VGLLGWLVFIVLYGGWGGGGGEPCVGVWLFLFCWFLGAPLLRLDIVGHGVLVFLEFFWSLFRGGLGCVFVGLVVVC